MKKEEILKERFWVMPLHAILRVLDKLPSAIMSIIHAFLLVPICIVAFIVLALTPLLILALLAAYLLTTFGWVGKVAACILFFVLFIATVIIRIKILNKQFVKSRIGLLNERTKFLRHFNPNLSGRLLQHYEKRWGMTNEEIENYISHRTQLGEDDSILYLLPIVSQLCQLNKDAREEQETFLSIFLNEDEIEDIFDKTYSDVQTRKSYRYWRGKELREKKSLMELLFKLTIEQDGIHNDEWYMLFHLMTQLKLGNRNIKYFKNRYFSLRTEFDDYKRKKTSSKVKKPIVNLNPYYAILELKEGASIEEIKRAYHNLALKHHPDLPKNAGKIKECEEIMKKINEAYEKLRG